MRKTVLVVAATAFLSALPAAAQAHQPRLVGDEDVVRIEEPAISKAYYGKLRGEPQQFELKTDKRITFFAQITVPDVRGAETDFSVEIADVSRESPRTLAEFHGESFAWKPFSEFAGGDTYLGGFESRQRLVPGTYRLTVSSPDNRGTYVLATGQEEALPLGEVINTIRLLPTIKADFFGKSPLTALISPFVLIALGAVILPVTAVVLLTVWMRRRRAVDAGRAPGRAA